MESITIFALYFILWWVMLFVTLPFGIHTQDDEGDVTLGTTSSAPLNPWGLRKFVVNTIATTIVFAILWFAVAKLGFGIDSFDFLGPQSLNN